MSSEIRVRFAPSPTGFLHIGGVRTALYNWLYARNLGGKFLLRIEDTDLERSEARFTADILESMKWLGLNWDEEPLYQSKRLDLYRAKVEELIMRDQAYYCTCSEADVDAMRELAMKEGRKPMYDRRCRGKKTKPAGAHVIRASIPLEGSVEFEDLIRGVIKVENREIDDFVLIRSNGAPTYNLSVVVDDVDSRMTHIIRGDDHINNTPKQLHLYRHFGYPVPKFAHLPMILGTDKKKLSKRHGAVSANVYRADGYLPETLLGFLARCGWSHGDQEVFTIDELVQFFGFDHVQKSSAVFNPEKLLWLSGEHIRRADLKRLAGILVSDFSAVVNPAQVQSELGLKLLAMIQPKVKRIAEIAEAMAPLLASGTLTVDASSLKWNQDAVLKEKTKAAVTQVLGKLKSRPDHAACEAAFKEASEACGVKLGDLMQPVRLCLTGKTASPSVFELLEHLPWETSKPRLEQVLSL